MRRRNSSSRPQVFGAEDIASQFQGMEVEFDDKVALFPVQVEKQEFSSRNRSDVLQLKRK